METEIDKNESEFNRMKRQAEEWLEKDKNKTAPPFLHLALSGFKPIEQPGPVPVSAEIDRQWINEIMDKTNEFAKQLIKDHFDRHASQFQSKPTDEEIEEYFLKEEPRGYGCSWYKGMVEGAKAMRDNKLRKQ